MRNLRTYYVLLAVAIGGCAAVYLALRPDARHRAAGASGVISAVPRTVAPGPAIPSQAVVTGWTGGRGSPIARVAPPAEPVLSGETVARLDRFDAWLEQWVRASAAERGALAAAGRVAAEGRREIMRQLIASNPREALARAVPAAVHAILPATVQAQLEVPFDARGDFEVACSCFGEDRSHGADRRTVVVAGARYTASVYGRREPQPTKQGMPLHGVALDGVAALREEPLRRLEAMELTVLGFTPAQIVVRVGGDQRELSGAAELAALEARLVAAESVPGPNVAGTADGPARTAAAPTAWTTGEKKVLVIRVDFSDLAGEPQVYLDAGALESLTAQAAVNWMNTKVAPLFQEFSYGKTTLTATATSKVYRLPQTAAAYATADFSVLHQAAQAAAAADYVLANYDRLVVAFGSLASLPGSSYQFAGLASRGGKEVWINGNFWCVGHELGHTFGLPHANLWQVTDLNPISDAGTSTSYGDPFDIMGGAVNYDGRAHFTPWGKNVLGWLADAQVQTVTASGTYRVYRFDDAAATGTLALKIARDSTRSIWIGLRCKFTDNAALSHGAYVLWGHPSGEAVNLLDLTTPGSNPSDAALTMGRSYIDPVANVTIKPVAEGGTTPGEYLDVQVTFGPAAPSLYVPPAPAATGVGLSAVFNISAAGIPAVVYRWQRLLAGATAWMNVTDGDTYSGGATNVLTVKTAAVAMTGDQFRCIVSNSVGQLISSPGVPLTVNATGVATVAGRVGVFLQEDGLGSGAAFSRPSALAYGADGTLYATEQYGGVRKISPRGEVSTLVATLSSPNGLAVGGDGTVYVSNYDTHTISKVSPSGVASVWAGASGVSGSADGPVASARFNAPSGLALDAAGNLYVTDFRNRTIRRISAAGDVTTLAGMAGQLGTVDGVGASARFSYPNGVTVDPWGTLYVVDAGRIRRIASDLQVTTLPDPDHRLNLPYGLSADPFGNLWVADWENSMVFRIKPDRSIVAVAGLARETGSADGAGAAARFYHLNGLARDAAGAIFVADADNNTIRRIVVPGLPQISTQPAAQVVGAGTTLTLTVAGADPAGYAYQWFKDGSVISGATNSVYSKPAAQLADGGLYSVAVANSEGSITSVPARVTVGLGMVSPPVAQSVYLGQPLMLSVGVASVGTPTYQWRKDGVDLPGATGASFSLAAAGTVDGGNYSVAVSSAAGSLLSPAVAVTLKSPVVGWVPSRYTDFTTPPAGLGEVKAIAAGSEHCLALRKDGTVVTWGSSRPVLAVPTGLNNVVSIAASVYGPVSGAVKSDGSVVVWGDTLYYGLPTVPPGLSNVRSIAFGERTLLALKADGSLVWWYYPNFALTVPAAAVNVVGIASGRYSGAALKSDGTVVTWGSTSVPPPAGLSGVVAVSAGGVFLCGVEVGRHGGGLGGSGQYLRRTQRARRAHRGRSNLVGLLPHLGPEVGWQRSRLGHEHETGLFAAGGDKLAADRGRRWPQSQSRPGRRGADRGCSRRHSF